MVLSEKRKKHISHLSGFYQNSIENDFLVFWNKALDKKNGGIFTCYSNRGDHLISKDKYIWSQGRFMWIWAHIIELAQNNLLNIDPKPYAEHLEKTTHFIEKNAFLPNGNAIFLLSADGKPKETVKGKGYDTSFYADCFVIIGFAACGRILNEEYWIQKALTIYDNVISRLDQNNVRSEPYPIPIGFKAFAFSMIMLNVSQELAEALKTTGHPRFREIEENARDYLNIILKEFHTSAGRTIELLTEHESLKKSLLYRQMTPGHSIECLWFMLHTAEVLHINILESVEKIMSYAWKTGWDVQYGGLLRCVDFEGGKPKGSLLNNSFEKLILQTWDSKLWWPHSELLYTTMLLWYYTHNEKYWDMYQQAHDYVFSTFPNPDKKTGEWIQIRDRQGKPMDKQVALPVKDPFHVLRNMILMIKLLKGHKGIIPKTFGT